MEFFYSEDINGGRIFLTEEESHHCTKVMRHKIGEELKVTDGKGMLFSARIISEEKRKVILEVLEVKKVEQRQAPHIHVAIAPTKNIDRFEFFLEKAVEIGVMEITPIISQRSERERVKHERLEKIIMSSMKQSLRLWLPELSETVKFSEFSNQQSAISNQKFIAHCQSENLPSLKSLYKPGSEVTILIGPEGDFTREEITLAEQNGFVSVSLSEARLRTETAGIIALHTVKLLNG